LRLSLARYESLVKDRNGYALAYVHYEEEPGRRSAASRGKLTNAKLTIRALSFLGSSGQDANDEMGSGL
jgi:hypothetical protein